VLVFQRGGLRSRKLSYLKTETLRTGYVRQSVAIINPNLIRWTVTMGRPIQNRHAVANDQLNRWEIRHGVQVWVRGHSSCSPN
jgi:hypothetical protein